MSKLVIHESHSMKSDKPWSRICRRCAIRENQSQIEKRCAANANYPPEPYEGPMWSDIKEEVSVSTEWTQEEINKELLNAVVDVDRGVYPENVHKIREIFNENSTVAWFVTSKSGKPVEHPYEMDSTHDEIVVVTFLKDEEEIDIQAFERGWTNRTPAIRPKA